MKDGNRMVKYIQYIKKYGLMKCLWAFAGTLFFSVIRKVYVFYLCRFCPIEENKLIFSSTPSFSDNSKVLYDYLRKTKTNLKFVWIVDDTETATADKDTLFVKRRVGWHSGYPLETLRHIFTSKYLFFTHESPFRGMKKREDQIVVNLWHGCGYKSQISGKSWSEQNPCDYSLIPGAVYKKAKAAFWDVPENSILTIGYPRYDLFRTEMPDAKDFSYQLRGYSSKLIIWMPTYRKSIRASYPEAKIQRCFELPIINSYEQLGELNDYLKERQITVCIKRHPSQVKYTCESRAYSNIVFISNDDLIDVGVDLYSLLRYTDALISDYSSVAIDYLLLDKPMAFSLDDYEQYKSTRGFVFDDPLKYMSGHHLYNFEDMLVFIDDVANGCDSYKSTREEIMKDVHNPCNNYCQRLLDFLKI